MRTKKNVWICFAFLVVAFATTAQADTKANPYEPIVDRNAFGLRPPPPPPDPAANLPPPAPPAKVRIAGITSIGSKKKALLEIEPAPGKPMIRPVLEEGTREDAIEVVAIDVENNKVTIKNNGVVTNLTLSFETPKATGPAAAAGIVGAFNPPNTFQPVNTSYVPPTPQAFTPSNPNSTRGGVTVAGGGGATAPIPAATAFTGGAAPFGGAATTFGGAGGFTANTPTVSGGTPIPTRVLRGTDNPAQPVQPPADPAAQYINLRAAEIRARQQGIAHPPTPPIPGLE